VAARRWPRQPRQQVPRASVPAASAAHSDSEGHVRAEASEPAAGRTRGLLGPLVRECLGHLAMHGEGAGRTARGGARLLRKGDSTGVLECGKPTPLSPGRKLGQGTALSLVLVSKNRLAPPHLPQP
jgi:hypothetical protein